MRRTLKLCIDITSTCFVSYVRSRQFHARILETYNFVESSWGNYINLPQKIQGENSIWSLSNSQYLPSKWPTMGEWCNDLANWLHNWQFHGDFEHHLFCLAFGCPIWNRTDHNSPCKRGMRAFRSCHIISPNNEINAHSIYHTHMLILLFLMGWLSFITLPNLRFFFSSRLARFCHSLKEMQSHLSSPTVQLSGLPPKKNHEMLA